MSASHFFLSPHYTYTGLTSTTFKARLGTHKISFKNSNANQKSLSRHIDKLKKKKNITHSIKWEKWAVANPSLQFQEYVLCVPQTNVTSHSSLGWVPSTKRVKCIQIVGIRNVYYCAETRPRPRLRLDNHNFNYVLSLFTCD